MPWELFFQPVRELSGGGAKYRFNGTYTSFTGQTKLAKNGIKGITHICIINNYHGICVKKWVAFHVLSGHLDWGSRLGSLDP